MADAYSFRDMGSRQIGKASNYGSINEAIRCEIS
jgi:hypothetical protein